MRCAARFVTRQISAVLSDLGADAIKTGMLPKTDIIEAFALAIDDYEGLWWQTRLWLPVQETASLQDEAVAALQSCLLVRADLVTPNLPEAEVLTGRGVETLDDMKFAADALMNKGVQAALIKGGHLARSGSAVVQDLLATQAGFQLFENPRLDSQNTHGTGCSLASAIATGLGQGLELAAAVERGIAYVRGAIFYADAELGRGTNKPLNHGWVLAPQTKDG